MSFYQTERDLLLAVRSYQKLFNGSNAHTISYESLKATAEQLQKEYGIANFNEKYLQEVHRSKGWSNINIYSIAGAMAGQEAIKLITNCFTPMNGGYIFDGANGVGYQLKL